MMMVKAGKPVDLLIEQLIPHLEEGDIIIDGGNSLYTDSMRRTEYLESKGIAVGVHYPVPAHAQRALRGHRWGGAPCPVSERLCAEVLSIPVFPEITRGQQRYVVESIEKFYEKRR